MGRKTLLHERVQARTRTPPGMAWIEAGVFHMGSDAHYPEEAPIHLASVDGFWIDLTPVTNREFARFAAATGYVTMAEQVPVAADYPGADPALLRPGSLVFRTPTHLVDPDDWRAWWTFAIGADWRHPAGPGSDLEGLADHPVVHVCYADAQAYAAWAGKSLPGEAEWEYAARGGFDRAEFSWGDELAPGGVHRANTWQGLFPVENLALDGYVGTSPVTAFPPNGYGLYDMIGNVWEWTADHYADSHAAERPADCCAMTRGTGKTPGAAGQKIEVPRKVLKGGSHLCAPNYCRRYRPAARQAQTIDTASGHIGFRCVLRDAY